MAFQNLAYSDLSLLVKAGVQFGLFGGAILHLGTERHHERYLRDLIAGRLIGCFAMSETGHGSNVHDLETTATYDPASDEFVLETPTRVGSQGLHRQRRAARPRRRRVRSAGRRGRAARSPCPRRPDPRQPMDSRGRACEIEDCGPKLGLNGVDNGRIWFDGVRVPRESLLNRYADVTADGVYTSPIDNPDRRFFTMLGTLVQGRVSIGGRRAVRQPGRAHDRRQVRESPTPVRAVRGWARGHADDLPNAPAAAAARFLRGRTR